MANPINCDMGCGLLAVFLVGNLDTGDQTAFCMADFARAGLATAAAQLPRDEILAALGIKPTVTVSPEPPAEAEPKARKSKRGKAAEPAAGPEASEGLAEAPPAPTDG